MMKRLVATMCALALSAPVVAQAAAQVQAPAAAAADPALTRSVRELLTLMKYREQLTARLQQTAQAMPKAVLQAQAVRINANAKLTEEQKKAELAIAANDIPKGMAAGQRVLSDPKLVDDIFERVVPMYARLFTLAEVNDLLAFYRSPTAAKLQGLLPQIMQETNQLTQEMVRERLATVIPQAPRKK
ncbi:MULTISPECIES: DUF2059 domain-containing protein [unclassified Massilia]|uniref:DUF2059 domain-containing protein n=1 Tax=unclassified Massilia TaxID=2609279 RepID=UPI0017823A70|nr:MULTISPECIES: DUF2059 domain-containing protein [unclassified Massilia]MBD8531932.1 DUF2059 domain-containing protein [Massilia sp. CFBP 13647]MBD8675454.1 DUF2059 domain-containing protein [Massilia sp. CFBP 13721]